MPLPVKDWLFRPRQPPLEWLLDLNRIPIRIFVFILLGSAVVQCGSFVSASRAGASTGPICLAIVGLCLLTSVALCYVRRLSGRAAVEWSIIVVLFLVIVTLGSAISPLTEDLVSRARLHASSANLLKPFPAVLGFPLTAAVCCMVWALVADIGAYQLNSILYGDPMVLQVPLSCVATTLLWLGMACLTSSRLWSLFDVQVALTTEKALMEDIIAMMSDASVWLSEDGKTILRTDLRLEVAMGRRIDGESFADLLPDAERQRVQEGIERARAAPILLPTTLLTQVGATIRVDMFIVGNRGSRGRKSGSDSSPAFLLGIRYAATQDPEIAVEARLRQEHAGAWAEGFAEQRPPAPVDAQSGLSSLPTTTPTGIVFESVDIYAALEEEATDADADTDEATEASVRASLEKVASLGRSEGWLIPAGEVHLLPRQRLGEGSFGQVVCGWLYGASVAVKTTKTSEGGGTSVEDLAALANEIRILRHARHPVIVTFHGACLEPSRGEVMLVLERIQGPTLYEYARGLAADAEADKRCRVLLDISSALWYLHAQRPQIIHGDLKGSNILVEPRIPRARLLDFGLSRCRTKRSPTLGGSLSWMAPEVISTRSKPNVSADVFSFGRVALMVVTSRKPLQGMPVQEIVDRAKRGASPPVVVQMGKPLHAECAILCEKALSFAPERRPSMAEVHRELQTWVLTAAVAAEQQALPAARQLPEARAPLAPAAAEQGPPQAAAQMPAAAHDGQRAGDQAAVALRFAPMLLGARRAMWRAMGWKDARGAACTATAGCGGGCAASGGGCADDGAAAAAEEGRGDAEAALVLPARRPTAELAKRVSLLECAMAWNFPVLRGSCCNYHAAVAEIERVCKLLRCRECGPFLGPFNDFQCSRCGVLDKEFNEICLICSEPASFTGTTLPTLPDIEEEEDAEAPSQPVDARCSL